MGFWISEANFIRLEFMPTKSFEYCSVLFCSEKSVSSTFKGVLGLKKSLILKAVSFLLYGEVLS